VKTEILISLLKLIFKDKYKSVKLFMKYLEEQETKSLKLDEWDSLFDMVKTTNDDMTKYEGIAWPTLLDDFNEWVKSKK